MLYIIPVSYTHLDVYKRQLVNTSVSIEREPNNGGIFDTKGSAQCDSGGGGGNDVIRKVRVPLSFTALHLSTCPPPPDEIRDTKNITMSLGKSASTFIRK